MFKFLENQQYPVILGIAGLFLTLVSYFKVEDITKLQISKYANPIYSLYLLGIFLIIISILIYISEKLTSIQLLGEIFPKWLKVVKVRKIKNGLSVVVNRSVINILFGRIEGVVKDVDVSLVVLPANEFFDDECIKDKRSALGAFIQAKYPNQIDKIESLITEKLENIPSENIEKEIGEFQLSYGTGTSVYLNEPLSSNDKILFVSVTTKRAGEGLRAEMSYIFKAVSEIQKVVADKRLSSVYVPLMGSGHGGLPKEVALFGILLAVCEVLTRPSGQGIKEFNIVIFQGDEKHPPSVPVKSCERLLKISAGIFSH